jgi:UDP-glucose 4-epimerase
MRIVVTGGAGFIGSHIVDAYIHAGHRVVVIDNLSSGSKRNLNPRAKFYKADIKNLSAMRRIFKRERPQVINHHAALVSVVESVQNPVETYRTNLFGTVNLLLAFSQIKARRKKFIYASTGGALYGNPKKIPADEHTPIEPLSPYGLSKYLAERAVALHAKENGFGYLSLRYSNVYGPRQDAHGEAGVVAIFSNLMKHGKKPTIFGDGSKTRDYVYVGDVVRANVFGLTRGKNVAINIGTGKQTSDQKVFAAIARSAGYKGRPHYAPFRPGEVNHISLNPHLAKKILGWTPKTNFAEGIKATAPTF